MISVIMATFNRASLLPRAIASLQRQTLRDWELVIVDDGSTDQTRMVVTDFTNSDTRIRYTYQANQGLTGARNAGLAAAGGELLTFLDSDDEYHPTHLQLRADFLAAHPEVDLLHGGVDIVGGPEHIPDKFDPTRLIPLAECCIGGTFFIRRHVAVALGGFRLPDYGNDFDFMQRARSRYTVATIAAPTYIYHRETPDSMCNQMEKHCR